MTMSLKQFSLFRQKELNYEELFIAVTSIQDKIDQTICSKQMVQEGNLNRFHYRAVCQEKKALKNYTFGDEDTPPGNNGRWLVTLYDVNLTLTKKNIQKSYIYSKTVLKSAL